MKKKKSSKIKYIAYVASSIDGRISKGSLISPDWTSNEDWNFFQKSLAKMNAVVVGHNTYKVSKNHLKWRNSIVLSSKANHEKRASAVIFVNPQKTDLKKFIERKKYKKVAILGGGQVYDFCLRNKMLDELFLTIEPYVFTTGVPMFSGALFQKYKFSLQSIKRLNTKGTILLRYKNES